MHSHTLPPQMILWLNVSNINWMLPQETLLMVVIAAFNQIWLKLVVYGCDNQLLFKLTADASG